MQASIASGYFGRSGLNEDVMVTRVPRIAAIIGIETLVFILKELFFFFDKIEKIIL